MPQLFPVLRNLASFHGYRGEFDKAIEYATEILRLADAQDDASMRVNGYTSSARTPGSPGSSRPGSATSTRRSRRSRAAATVPRRLRLGLDPRVSCLTTSGFFLWLLGYPDRAVERAERAIALATDLDHPVLARLRLLPRRVPPPLAARAGVVADRAESALRVAETSDLPIWRALATVPARRRDERPGPAGGRLRQIDRRPRPVPGPADAAGLLADDPLHAGRGPRRGRHARPRPPADRRGPRDRRQRHVLAPLFHIVRGDLSLLGPDADPAAATASYERPTAWRRSRRADDPAPRGRPACPDGDRRRTGRVGSRRCERSTRRSRKASGRPTSSEAAELLAEADATAPAGVSRGENGLIRFTMAAATVVEDMAAAVERLRADQVRE